ncbi:MAG TPA: YraN family protein [Syntrophales bacterium]|jgi:putative endonuclease|nr:YraN family protein [Syntrophales bacterium]HON22818.1 YraN family protein [Syntrophales bacterium]HOU78805.1 YraN family protein [Syntrophales bacterium]HPC31588.1 YraN family protein [Syntrophales bacterium]HQG34328.1 YraN family protein [Syntrophales bacterium]
MTRERISTGRLGEDIAARYLARCGYEILARNWQCPLGELDIVARDGGTLVFVEVRSRRSDSFGTPLESVGRVKQRKLSLVAACYLNSHGLVNAAARFDVAAVKLLPAGPEVELIRDAFDVRY